MLVKEIKKEDLTNEQLDVVDFLIFETETSVIYPFAITYEDMTLDMLDNIVRCCGDEFDTESIYIACVKVLGLDTALD